MTATFLPMLFRMRHIARWGLMHNSLPESLSLHSLECAFLTHFLAHIGNIYLGKTHNADRLAAHAMYHDAAEILTGDLPTPIKYYNSEILRAYKNIESASAVKLLESLPEELRQVYADYLQGGSLSEAERYIIKAADKLCAYIKCVNETEAGNKEFNMPLKACLEKVEALIPVCPELKYFMEHFIGAFSLSLDAIGASD
ncbi:MAG: 5'-deoxynucleotidase [Clostridiales bacterium]|jgi:5'-deoxynucleotidase|nr:5'-deoxynucleotidase [Clostridiales bacterium]